MEEERRGEKGRDGKRRKEKEREGEEPWKGERVGDVSMERNQYVVCYLIVRFIQPCVFRDLHRGAKAVCIRV